MAHDYDYDSPQWYEIMAEWSDSASAMGDIPTMLVAEIAMGHRVRLSSYALTDAEREEIERILSSWSPRLTACEIAARW